MNNKNVVNNKMLRRSERLEGAVNHHGKTTTSMLVTPSVRPKVTVTKAPEERTSTTPPTTGSSGTTPGPKAISNAASDVGPNKIEHKIIANVSNKRFRRFNYNWNNKVSSEEQRNKASIDDNVHVNKADRL